MLSLEKAVDLIRTRIAVDRKTAIRIG